MAKMSEDDLRDLIGRRRDASLKYKEDLSRERRQALEFYRGDNLTDYGNSGDGLSTVVSRDVLEAIESILPGLVKPFIAGDEVVRYEPTGPEDEEAAKQATEYVNYLFQNHNDAVRVVYDFTKDGLLYKLGVAKVVYETINDDALETFTGLSPEEVLALEAQDGYEIVGDVVQDENGLLEVRCSYTREKPRFRVYVIAPDEFLFEERLASLDEGRFFGHRSTKPVGDFIAMGLPAAKVKALKSGDGTDDDQDSRFEFEDRRDDGEDDDDLARLVTVDECYIRCDFDGSGVLGWRRVFIGANGRDLLLNEEADDHPYCVWTPVPVPHKLVGMSIYDLVRDLQMQGTALVREALNALYLTNRPQREVVEGQVNFEDLLNPEVGGVIRVKAPGQIREIPTGGEGVVQQSMVMLEQIATMREQRTGSTRYNQGMDANSLNKTATGISIIQTASQQRQELVARHLAEGMKSIFKKMLELVCRHLDKKEVIRLRGKWVEMDPAEWKEDYDMSVSVGLGTGNRDQQIGQLTNLLNLDKEIIELQGGANGPIVTMENVYEKLKRLQEAMALKGDKYYTDPTSDQQPEQPDEDPNAGEQVKAQAEIEKVRIKAQADIEIARINNETKLIIANMKVPPELQAVVDAFSAPPEPQEAPQTPPGPQMMPQEPPAAPDEMMGQ
jgi:hypothetical protein